MHEAAIGLSVYYASFAAVPLCLWLAVSAASRPGRSWRLALAGVLGVVVYARFIEPHLLFAPRQQIVLDRCFTQGGKVRLALLSDLHIGRFANSTSVARIVRTLDKIAPDAALIAGDFVYYLREDRIDEAFAPFHEARTPIYSVYGNHDIGLAEPDVNGLLDRALTRAGVAPVDNRTALVAGSRGAVEVAGFTDFRTIPPRRDHIAAPSDIPRILLTHYPGWADELVSVRFDLMAAGHTHGGQVFIPHFTCKLRRHACEMTRYGLTRVQGRQLFVTSGTGLVQLPLRFLVPPRIDVLDIRFEACPKPAPGARDFPRGRLAAP